MKFTAIYVNNLRKKKTKKKKNNVFTPLIYTSLAVMMVLYKILEILTLMKRKDFSKLFYLQNIRRSPQFQKPRYQFRR